MYLSFHFNSISFVFVPLIWHIKNLHTHSGCSTFLISVQSNPYLQMDSLFFIAPSLSRRERVIHTKLFCTSITLCKYSVMCINKNANTHTHKDVTKIGILHNRRRNNAAIHENHQPRTYVSTIFSINTNKLPANFNCLFVHLNALRNAHI